MRRLLGVLLVLLAVPLALAAATLAVLAGPDDTVGLLDQRLDADSPVVVSDVVAPRVTGPELTVRFDAEGAGIFLGAAHPVHVRSFVDGVAHDQLSPYRFRADVEAGPVAGDEVAPAAPPADLDWWQASATGTGTPEISLELTGEPLTVVLAGADLTAPPAGRLGATLTVDGLFGATLLSAGVCALLALLGVRVARRRRSARDDRGRDHRDQDDDEYDQRDNPPPRRSRRERGRRRRGRCAAGSSRPGQGTPVAMSAVAQTAVALAGLTIAGCGQLPGLAGIGSGASSDTGSVRSTTDEQAGEFFAHYSETLTTAAPAHDAEAITTVEGGPLRAATQLGFANDQVRGTRPELGEVAPSSVLAARLDAYPLWFLATTPAPDGSGATDHYLVVRDTATSPWLATRRVRVDDGVEAPVPDAVDGVVRLTDETTATHGGRVLDTVLAYAETGTVPDGVDVTDGGGLSELSTQGFAIAAETAEFGTEQRSCALDATQPVRWVASGPGAMALATVECTQEITLSAGYWMTTPAEGYWTIPGGTDIVASTVTQAVSFIVELNADGTARVVGDRMQPTATSHTPR